MCAASNHRVLGLAWRHARLGPGQLDPQHLLEQRLKVRQLAGAVPHLARSQAFAQAVSREGAGYLADVPLHRMQPVTAIGDVRGADILAGWQQIFDAHRDQGAERDLEGPAWYIDIGAQAGAGVQIDAIAADADAIGEQRRALLRLSRFNPDMCKV